METEQPRLSVRDFKALQTTRQRGETLTADGYSFTPNQERPGIYEAKSEPRKRRDGSLYHSCHTVDAYGGTCDCVAFSRFGECKHIIGLAKALQEAFEKLNEALRLVGPLVSAPVAPGFSSRAAFETARAKDFD